MCLNACCKRLEALDRTSGIEGSHAVLGEALDLDGLGGVEDVDGAARVVGRHTLQSQLPYGSREPVGEPGGPGLDGFSQAASR
jgi:hypothetical protein